MKRYIQYFKYVLKHKFYVFIGCFKYGCNPILGILHDWSKFRPDEFIPYAKTFYDEKGNSQFVKSDEFYNAMHLHYKRNKHHWQYWGKQEIPTKYMKEMIADWYGAQMVLHGKTNLLGFLDKSEFSEKRKEILKKIIEKGQK